MAPKKRKTGTRAGLGDVDASAAVSAAYAKALRKSTHAQRALLTAIHDFGRVPKRVERKRDGEPTEEEQLATRLRNHKGKLPVAAIKFLDLFGKCSPTPRGEGFLAGVWRPALASASPSQRLMLNKVTNCARYPKLLDKRCYRQASWKRREEHCIAVAVAAMPAMLGAAVRAWFRRAERRRGARRRKSAAAAVGRSLVPASQRIDAAFQKAFKVADADFQHLLEKLQQWGRVPIHVPSFQASLQKSLHFVGNRDACGQELRKKTFLGMSFEKNALLVVGLRFEKVVQWRRRRGWRPFSTSTRFVEGCRGGRRIHCRPFSTANLYDHQCAAAVDVVNFVLAFEGQKQCRYVTSSSQGQFLGAKVGTDQHPAFLVPSDWQEAICWHGSVNHVRIGQEEALDALPHGASVLMLLDIPNRQHVRHSRWALRRRFRTAVAS